MLTELQQTTLCDVLRTAGLKERQIEDIQLLLRFKPQRVQLAFYYVATGKTQEEAGKIIRVSQRQIGKYITRNCSDIKKYLYIEPNSSKT